MATDKSIQSLRKHLEVSVDDSHEDRRRNRRVRYYGILLQGAAV